MTPDEFAAKLGDAYQPWLEETLNVVTLIAERGVKRRTPVVTGTLRRSITSRVEAAAERGIVGTNIVYARPVDRRRQFMQKGLDDSQGEIESALADQGGLFWSRIA